MDPGMAHYRCPDKYPKARIKTISLAGELNIPWTSGILIGIGENWDERIDSILELNRINNLYGHIQEIIIQNFKRLNTKVKNLLAFSLLFIQPIFMATNNLQNTNQQFVTEIVTESYIPKSTTS